MNLSSIIKQDRPNPNNRTGAEWGLEQLHRIWASDRPQAEATVEARRGGANASQLQQARNNVWDPISSSLRQLFADLPFQRRPEMIREQHFKLQIGADRGAGEGWGAFKTRAPSLALSPPPPQQQQQWGNESPTHQRRKGRRKTGHNMHIHARARARTAR